MVSGDAATAAHQLNDFPEEVDKLISSKLTGEL
jgi:hypothetical protein